MLKFNNMNECMKRKTVYPIIIQGNKFVDSVTGDEFFIRGIDYYPRPNFGDWNRNSLDFYTSNTTQIWKRDIQYFQQLNINAIRLYSVNASLNHDEFMCALSEIGIYVIVALASASCAITHDKAPDCYPTELKLQGQRVINAFSKYNNTLAFSAGNEVNHYAPPANPQWNAPCQKKFIQDMRNYVRNRSGNSKCATHFRSIPIGLVSADDSRIALAEYYASPETDDALEVPEWYGLNAYVSCDGNATTYDEALGLKKLVNDVQQAKLPFPFVLTEFGCLSLSFPNITVPETLNDDDHTENSLSAVVYEGQRNFYEARWLLLEPSVHEVFAGGFAFEYSIENENAKSESPYPYNRFGHQNYGIGYFSPEHCDDYEVFCNYHPMPAFQFLKDAYNSYTTDCYNDNSTKTTSNAINNSTVCNFFKGLNTTFVPRVPVFPQQFPRLDSLTWIEDHSSPNFPDLCPTSILWHNLVWRSNPSFTCPAICSKRQSTNTSNTLDESNTMVYAALFGFLLVSFLFTRTFIRSCHRYPSSLKNDSGIDKQYNSSTTSPSVKLHDGPSQYDKKSIHELILLPSQISQDKPHNSVKDKNNNTKEICQTWLNYHSIDSVENSNDTEENHEGHNKPQ